MDSMKTNRIFGKIKCDKTPMTQIIGEEFMSTEIANDDWAIQVSFGTNVTCSTDDHLIISITNRKNGKTIYLAHDSVSTIISTDPLKRLRDIAREVRGQYGGDSTDGD